MKRICVYCGSSRGGRTDYANAARELAQVLVQSSIELVYGGADRGIMGILADTVLAAGGKVSGVIPKALVDKEVAHAGLTELYVVDSMHERKSLMAGLSDGFVALPGGFGTLEEIIEVLTWGQLQFHSKPCGLLNTNGYFDLLLRFIGHAESEGFLRPQHREMLLVEKRPTMLINRLESYVAPDVGKWTSQAATLED